MKIRFLYIITGTLFLLGCKKSTTTVPDKPTPTATFQVFNSKNSPLPSDSVNQLFVHNNILFIATSKGLALLNPGGNWSIYNSSNLPSLASNHIKCVWINDSVWWIGTNQGLLSYRLADMSSNFYNTSNSPLPANNIRSLSVDKVGNLWIGTFSGGGLCVKDGNTWQVYTPSNSPLPNNSVAKIFNQDTLHWIATAGGLSKFNGTNWYTYTTANSNIPHPWVYDIIEGNNASELWIATNNGIANYNIITDAWNIYNASTTGYMIDLARYLYYDKVHQEIWITTNGSGLFKFKISTNEWVHYTYDNSGLASNYLKSIVVFNGHIWIGTLDKGIVMLN